MDCFLQGTNVTAIIPMQDKYGNTLTVSSISYSVIDEQGDILVSQAPLPAFVAGSPSATVIIPAAVNIVPAINLSALPSFSVNSLPTPSAQQVRTVQLDCIDNNGNTLMLSYSYCVEQTDALVPGINSFVTYAQAEKTSMQIPNTSGWDGALVADRTAALMQARDHICQLNFAQLNSNVNWGQDSLSFVPEGQYTTSFATPDGMFLFSGNLSFLTLNQYQNLPPMFLNALYKAQVSEADFILGGDPAEQLRQSGLVSNAVGEARQTYRSGKPLQLPCSRRTMSYLSYFLATNKRMTRV